MKPVSAALTIIRYQIATIYGITNKICLLFSLIDTLTMRVD